jgi:hypothetical protein
MFKLLKNIAPLLLVFFAVGFAVLSLQARQQDCDQECQVALAGDTVNTSSLIKPEVNLEQKFSQIEILKEQIQKSELKDISKLQPDSDILKKTEIYNQTILDVLETLPEETKIKVCKNNTTFIPSTKTEAKIKEICSNLTTDRVQGANTNTEYRLFIIERTDLGG